MDSRPFISAADVVEILDRLDALGVRVAVGGGWGIDALVGERTRPHGDLDLAIASEHAEQAIAALGAAGFRVVVDQRPVRFVLADGRGREVDFHPVHFGPTGEGRQAGFDGSEFVYPPGSLDATGSIGGRRVRCCSAELQVRFHLGYEPLERDRHDMELLRDRLGLSLPPAYRLTPPRSSGE